MTQLQQQRRNEEEEEEEEEEWYDTIKLETEDAGGGVVMSLLGKVTAGELRVMKTTQIVATNAKEKPYNIPAWKPVLLLSSAYNCRLE